MTSIRTEHSLIDKHIRQHNREAGEGLLWFEFAPLATAASAGSVYDDVYDEGVPGDGGRAYNAAKSIPTIYVYEFEDQFTPRDEGRQTVQNIRAAFLYTDLVRAGLTFPEQSRYHLSDILYYNGRYYRINDYHVRGKLPASVVVGIIGFEIYIDQEMPFDPGPSAPLVVDWGWPSTFPQVGV